MSSCDPDGGLTRWLPPPLQDARSSLEYKKPVTRHLPALEAVGVGSGLEPTQPPVRARAYSADAVRPACFEVGRRIPRRRVRPPRLRRQSRTRRAAPCVSGSPLLP